MSDLFLIEAPVDLKNITPVKIKVVHTFKGNLFKKIIRVLGKRKHGEILLEVSKGFSVQPAETQKKWISPFVFEEVFYTTLPRGVSCASCVYPLELNKEWDIKLSIYELEH